MRHLVVVTTSYPLTSDGSEAAGSFVADFAEELASQIQVTVVAPALEARIERPSDSLNIHYFAVPKLPLSLLKPQRPSDWFAIGHTLQAGLASLRHVVDNYSVDHVLALWVLPSGYWAKQVAEKRGIPYSTWALGSDIWSLGKLPVVRTLLKKVLHTAHTNFADGYQLKQSVEHLSKRTCHFLPSTRNLPILKEKQLSSVAPYRLAFLGRWHKNKGIDLLLDSLSRLTHEDWKKIDEIQIAGGGGMERLVNSAISELRSEGHPVTLHGYLNKSQSAELFSWADYVLIPSRIESIPVVFSDAMKCKCPIIAMPVGDLPRLVSQYGVGELADTVTAPAFAQAISRLLQVTPMRFENGLQLASGEFNVQHVAKVLLNL